MGSILGYMKGDTRSLDYSSFELPYAKIWPEVWEHDIGKLLRLIPEIPRSPHNFTPFKRGLS